VADLAISLATLLPHSGGPYIALMLTGFAVAILGHLSASRWLIAIGVILISLGAFLFPLALNLTESTPHRVEERAREAE
jgi:hypothetical protein